MLLLMLHGGLLQSVGWEEDIHHGMILAKFCPITQGESIPVRSLGHLSGVRYCLYIQLAMPAFGPSSEHVTTKHIKVHCTCAYVGDTAASRRLTEAVLYGCVPVLIGPPFPTMPLHTIVNYAHFSVILEVQNRWELA